MLLCPWSIHNPETIPMTPFCFKNRGYNWGYQRFIRRDVFEKSIYLNHDSLRIDCDVGVVVSDSERSILSPYNIQVPPSDILDAHFRLLLETDYKPSDVVFCVAGEQFSAHTMVFMARSPKFEAEYLRGMRERNDEIVVRDMDPKVFKAFLSYLYKDCLVAHEDLRSSTVSLSTSFCNWVVAKLLHVANNYELSRLRLMCGSFIRKHLKMDSYLEMHEIHSLASRCNGHDLKHVCSKFQSDVIKTMIFRKPELRSLLPDGGEILPYGPNIVCDLVLEGTTRDSRCNLR